MKFILTGFSAIFNLYICINDNSTTGMSIPFDNVMQQEYFLLLFLQCWQMFSNMDPSRPLYPLCYFLSHAPFIFLQLPFPSNP